MDNLFSLQSELVTLISEAVGTRAKVYTAYDLAKAQGRLSSHPAIYLLLDSMTVDSKTRTEVLLSQHWEVSFSVPVPVNDTAGDDATTKIGEMSLDVLSAMVKNKIAGVKRIELVGQKMNIGLVDNRLVIPFTFNAVLVKRLTGE